MDFQILGTLNVTRAGKHVSLGGYVKRALLSQLLLKANRVVSTADLLKALWPEGAPPTARKMLQNAVSDLRRMLREDRPEGEPPIILTHTPGYLLRVAPESVDLLRFQRLAGTGRAELAASAHESATKTLRSALSLHRGTVLSDLVAEGMACPDAEGIEDFVMNVYEDCFEAELALGRHRAVIEEMERLHQAAPLRERLCGQLMVALYRCGRQTDALALYRRIRSLLVDEFGMEPGHDLMALQSAILTQDSMLSLRSDGRAARDEPVRALPIGADGRTLPPTTAVPRTVEQDGRLSVVMVRVHVSAWAGQPTTGEIADVLADIAPLIHGAFEQNGGFLNLEVGNLCVAVFRPTGEPGGEAEPQAVRAALAIRQRFDCGPLFGVTTQRFTVRVSVAVATGEGTLRCRTGGKSEFRLTLAGGVTDRCAQLLEMVPVGEIRVCDVTRRATGALVDYNVEYESVRGWRPVVQTSAVPGTRARGQLERVN